MPQFVQNCLDAPGMFLAGLLVMGGLTLAMRVYDSLSK